MQRKKTADRILEESLVLFNEHGERHMTTNHIAAHLGISPGNLYYHFKNKEEIIVHIFNVYTNDMIKGLTLGTSHPTIHHLVQYLDHSFSMIWRYRFLFYDLPTLMSRNEPLQEAYEIFIEKHLKPSMMKHFHSFSRSGILNIDDDALNALVLNVWLVVKFWFTFIRSSQPKQPCTPELHRQGVLQTLALIKPYISHDSKRVFEEWVMRVQSEKEKIPR
jgi:AcrR family transcriptional regulator